MVLKVFETPIHDALPDFEKLAELGSVVEERLAGTCIDLC